MGRRRKNELKPGDNVTIYIPQDVERDVLHFMRTQANLSKTVFKILENYVLRKNRDFIEFDDFYSDRVDVAKQIMKDESLRRTLENKEISKQALENDIKEFIKNTIRSEIKSALGTKKTNEESKTTVEKSEIKSRHEDKLKVVQSIIESEEMEKNNDHINKDMDDLFNEFSKTIEEEGEKKVKSVDTPKSYLWGYEDE